jgi:hypothetical protein
MQERSRWVVVGIVVSILAGAGRHAAASEVDLASSAGIDANGNAAISVAHGGLRIDKTVTPSGEAAVRIAYGREVVGIWSTAGAITVSRNGKSATIYIGTDGGAAVDRVRRLLLGSPAVRAVRRLTTKLELDEGEDTLATMSTLVDGVLVGILDGDEGVAERVGRRLTRKIRASLRSAAIRDCVGEYEAYLLHSDTLLTDCLKTADRQGRLADRMAQRLLCHGEFLARSQSGIWQFIACTTVPTPRR